MHDPTPAPSQGAVTCSEIPITKENTIVVIKSGVLFAPSPTVQPILKLCYKLDIYNIIQGPSQNAS